MIIWSDFRMWQYRDHDHRKHAHHIKYLFRDEDGRVNGYIFARDIAQNDLSQGLSLQPFYAENAETAEKLLLQVIQLSGGVKIQARDPRTADLVVLDGPPFKTFSRAAGLENFLARADQLFGPWIPDSSIGASFEFEFLQIN